MDRMVHRTTKSRTTIIGNYNGTAPEPQRDNDDNDNKELIYKKALLLKLEKHLADLKMDAKKVTALSMATWPKEKRWMLGDIEELPLEPMEPELEKDKIVSLEDADDIVSWALDNWKLMRDLEFKPNEHIGFPIGIKFIQDRIVSTDGLEKAVMGQFALYVVSHGRSLMLDAIQPNDRGKLKLMRYIVVLSLPEPNAIAVDGKRLGVEARTVFRYAAGKDLITKPVRSQSKPLSLLSFLIHVPEEAM